MTITMNTNKALSFEQIKTFLDSSTPFQFDAKLAKDRNKWLEDTLRHYKYKKLSREQKGLLRDYMLKMTGISSSQLTKLIKRYQTEATLEPKEYKRNKFISFYTLDDIALLAKLDNAHDCLSGPATKRIIIREYEKFGKTEYERLKCISISHLYNFRETPRYRETARVFTKTNPTKVPIGIRQKPEPNGHIGYLCVDTVHQGDKDKEKGVYHINIVDMTTQFEFITCVPVISERYMIPVLENLIKQFPFQVLEVHADNGSEYINRNVVSLLNRLIIKLTKSRPRHSNDNGLVETKNGAIIRKHIGYNHIPKDKYEMVNEFYQNYLNPYLNYHRPCAFPETITDKKGKQKKIYPKDNYLTPYEKLKTIKNVNNYLKENISFEKLNQIAYTMSDTEFALLMQKEKTKMFSKIFK